MPTETPLVSIIIPTFNRAHLIGETLDSVLAQTYQNWECIVVDDGSKDATDALIAEYIAKDSRFQYHHRPIDRVKGANACRNIGFDKSRGDFLIFLDSDDLLETNCIENRNINESKKSSYDNSISVYSMGLLRYEKKTDQVFNKLLSSEKECLEYFLRVNPPWTITCVFWPREIFDKIGKFDELLKRLQDVDIHTRLLLGGVKINIVKFVDSWYRVLDNPKEYITEEKIPMLIQSHIQYIKKFYNHGDSEILKKNDINNCLKETYLKVLKKYVFRERIVLFQQVMALNKALGLLSFKKSRMIELLAFYHKVGVINKYGYTRIRNLIFNNY